MNTSINLLVIDDDDVDRLQLRRALKSCGFEYALTEYHEISEITDELNDFDCIFLDYLLPGENGLSLLKRIRDNGIKAPVVMITSQGNESIAVELMKAGASDYIVKNDINSQSLGQVIRNTVRIHQMLRKRIEAEDALRISESRLAEAQRIARVGNWEYALASDKLYWSPEIYNLLGFEDKNFVPTVDLFISYIHDDDRKLALSVWSDALKGKEFRFDFRVVIGSGIKHMHTRGYALRNSEGFPKKLIGTLQDITRRKLNEEEISKAREIAENSIKVKERFLANMSHEIRTPMNAVLGFTRLLYETTLTPEQLGYVDAINFSGENLLVIINDILDFSKIQSGKITIEKCDVNVPDLARDIIKVLQPKAQEKGLTLVCKIDRDVPAMLTGDPVRLNQILTNLLSNAIKFTETGSVTLEICPVKGKGDEVQLQFTVKDTGIGILTDKQSLIFDTFVQASDDTTRKFGGTGLGLSIVKSLVTLQHGKISVDSQLGKGSSFIVHLPFANVTRIKETLPSKPVKNAAAFQQISQLAVLVVEDNTVNQLLVRKVFEKVNCKVEIASNGLEAIRLIKSKPYDIVLMDVQMPEMDGYETTEHIRTQLTAPGSDVPIIAMTAHAFGDDISRCLSVGMNDYISKPFKAEELYQKMLKYAPDTKSREMSIQEESVTKPRYALDFDLIDELAEADVDFADNLIMLYDKQTPEFVENLKHHLKMRSYKNIRAICHQIASSYGMLKVAELNTALNALSAALASDKPEAQFAAISNHTNVIIAVITEINEEVKRSLKKAG